MHAFNKFPISVYFPQCFYAVAIPFIKWVVVNLLMVAMMVFHLWKSVSVIGYIDDYFSSFFRFRNIFFLFFGRTTAVSPLRCHLLISYFTDYSTPIYTEFSICMAETSK